MDVTWNFTPFKRKPWVTGNNKYCLIAIAVIAFSNKNDNDYLKGDMQILKVSPPI